MATTDRARETVRVAVELAVAIKRLRARLREETANATGLTSSQLVVLERILTRGPLTAASIAAAEHVSPQAVAQSLAGLKGAGLVRAKPDPTDGRKSLLEATAAGRRLREQLMDSRDAWLVRAIEATVGDDERETLAAAVELLGRLAAADLGPSVEIR